MPARFVWPPNPKTASEPADIGEEEAIGPSEAGASIDEPAQPRPRSVAARSASPLLEIERTWLGLIAPPLDIRMAEAGWAPDPWVSYCQRCGVTAGPHDADDTGCSTCRGHRLPWDRLIRLGEYEGVLREMVHEVKFQRWRRLGDDLGRLLGKAVGESLDRAGVPRELVVVVPMPSTFRRRTFRGVDHALVIARGVAAELGSGVVQALSRAHRPSQTSLPRSDRVGNVAKAFRPRSLLGSSLGGRTIVLVDDVTTTRATLRAAAKAVLARMKSEEGKGPGGVTRIWAAVLAVTPEMRAKRGSGGGRKNGPESPG